MASVRWLSRQDRVSILLKLFHNFFERLFAFHQFEEEAEGANGKDVNEIIANQGKEVVLDVNFSWVAAKVLRQIVIHGYDFVYSIRWHVAGKW